MVRKHKHREHAYAPSLRGGVELLLAENVESLGKQGDIVRVKPGFARNYLLPQGYATVATEENKLMVEKHREQLKEFAVKQKKMKQKNWQNKSAVTLLQLKQTPTKRGTSTVPSLQSISVKI